MQIGRYRVLGELGRGAMGIVYRAQDPAIGRIIAIKSIRLNELSDAEERTRLRERLFREAQSAGILSHPNIVTIYDILEEDGLAYIFMEFVNGKPLDDVLRARELPTGEQLVQLLTQTANALDYAHKKGIIHRDIKPANVMVHEDSIAKVCDFGIAKITSQSMTQTGVVMGTPSYMSPELIKGETLTGASDQFALAIMAYEILTGQKPFKADYLPTLFFKVCSDEPPAVHEINPTLNPMADRAVRKALAKKPEDRFATCTEFMKTLERAIAGTPDWTPMAKGPLPITEDSTTGTGGRIAVGTAPPFSSTSGSSASSANLKEIGQSEATATSFSLSSSGLTGQNWSNSPSVNAEAPVTPATIPPRPLDPQDDKTRLAVPKETISPAAPQPPAPTAPAFTESQRLPKLHPAATQSTPVNPPAGASQSMRIPSRDRDEASTTPAPGGGGMPKPVLLGVAAVVLAVIGFFAYSQLGGSSKTPATDPAATDPAVTGQVPASPGTPVANGGKATPSLPGKQASGTAPPVQNHPAAQTSAANTNSKEIKPPAANETQVSLTSTPPGATFTLDGGEVNCKTPCTLPLKSGRHSVQAALTGYVTMFRSIEVPQVKELAITLPEATGILSIVSTPKGATITIDGQPRSEVTPARITLREGPHKIDLVLGSLKDSHEVTVRQGGIQQIQSTWQ